MSSLLLALALLAAAPDSTRPTPVERSAAASISPGLLQGHVRFLSSDLLEGRGVGTAGDRVAQAYIAAQFELLGLSPAGTDGYLQPFDVVGFEGHPTGVSVNAGSRRLELEPRRDFVVVSRQPKARVEDAELVFVGYGIAAPEYQWDDFKDVDVTGKVLIILNSDPEDDPALFAGKTRLWYGRWDYKFEMAAQRGARGALIIHTTASAGYPWDVVLSSWSGEQFDETGEALHAKGWLTEDAAARVVAFSGRSLEALRARAQTRSFRPEPLGVTLRCAFDSAVTRRRTANVLGILPGSDPSRSHEWVVLTAHHDHLGIDKQANAGEDGVYNGAVDNAAGVASMLAIAQAMTRLPKAARRSVLFAAVAAEEQGLLGSRHLVENPPVPVGRMAANINIDGANIWGRTRDVTAIGWGKSTIDEVLSVVASQQGREVKPDPLPDRGFFYRSDQFNFARRGVPAAYFGSGLDFEGRPDGWGRSQREAWEQRHYHRPSDQLSPDWDWTGAVEDARLGFGVVLRIANAPQMPRWKAGDEFEAARMRALDQARSKAAGTR